MAQQFYDNVELFNGFQAKTQNQDIDFNLNDAQNFVVERINSSLPSDTGLQHKGRLIMYAGNLYYHNGGTSSTASENWVAFAKASDLSDFMTKAVYDKSGTGANGIVDDSEKLGSQSPSYYLNMSNAALTGILATARGGTGLSGTGGANTLLGVGATGGGALEYKTLSGTSNRVSVVNAAGTITLSAPQDLHTGAEPAFAKVILSAAVTANNQAATKAYVDSMATGLQVKTAVVCATTSNITLSGLQTIDGIILSDENRVLVKNQTLQQNNGIYRAKASAWIRSDDANESADLRQAYVWVENGDVHGDQSWSCTVLPTFVLGTDPCTWEKFSAAGRISAGEALDKSGETLNVLYDNQTIGLDTNNKLFARIAGDNLAPALEVDGSNSSASSSDAYGLSVKVRSGGGIAKTSDGLQIDAGYGYKAVTGTLTTPAQNTNITINHSLGTIPVSISFRSYINGSPIYPETVEVSGTQVVIKFTTASGGTGNLPNNVVYFFGAQR